MGSVFDKNKLKKKTLINKKNEYVCDLIPLNNSFVLNHLIVDLFVKWRNKYMKYFKTQFLAEHEQTKLWINKSIKKSDSVLFLIQFNGKPVGHFGLNNISKNFVELDNAIRGEREGPIDLFYHIEKYLIDISFNFIGTNNVKAKVLSNNFLALKMHENIGFQIKSETPLKFIKNFNYSEYIECSKEDSNVEIKYVELILNNYKK